MAESFAYEREPHLLRNLTDRERDLIPHIVAGKSDKQIAHEVCMSTQTLKFHMGKMYKALGLRGRTSLAVYAATGWRPPNSPEPELRPWQVRAREWARLEEEAGL